MPVCPRRDYVETLGVAVNPDGTKAYVACAYNIVGYNGMVSVIDIATNKVIATVPVGGAMELQSVQMEQEFM